MAESNRPGIFTREDASRESEYRALRVHLEALREAAGRIELNARNARVDERGARGELVVDPGLIQVLAGIPGFVSEEIDVDPAARESCRRHDPPAVATLRLLD